MISREAKREYDKRRRESFTAEDRKIQRERTARWRFQLTPEGKAVSRQYARKWAANNKPKLKALRRKATLKKIGFTLELIDEAKKLQEMRCPICQCDLAALPPKRIHADHCHVTKSARGVLCMKCNVLLGLAKDDAEILRRAANYLESPTL